MALILNRPSKHNLGGVVLTEAVSTRALANLYYSQKHTRGASYKAQAKVRDDPRKKKFFGAFFKK